jgi:hypothetical protein
MAILLSVRVQKMQTGWKREAMGPGIEVRVLSYSISCQLYSQLVS